jgi:uncharacterized protein
MRISVKVQPRASKEYVVKTPDAGIKVYLNAPPVGNKANESLIRILAEYFSVNKSKIKIITGRQSRNKIIEIVSVNEPRT